MAVRLESTIEAAELKPPVYNADLSPEIFRQLFVSLDLDPESNPIIGVTSAIAGEGCTTVAVGLATTLANDIDRMVSLVEVNLEEPTLSKRFDAPQLPGLAEVIRDEKRLTDVQCLIGPNLCLIPGGRAGAGSSALLHQLSSDDPFHGAHALNGILILDLPPILSYGYSALAAGVADAIVLVVRAGVTPIDIVKEAVGRLDTPPRGIVLNASLSALPSWWPEHGN